MKNNFLQQQLTLVLHVNMIIAVEGTFLLRQIVILHKGASFANICHEIILFASENAWHVMD